MTVEEWDAIFNVNVKATFLMCRAFLPGMLKARSGHIVNIGSTAAFCGANNLHAYASTKGAVVQLTRSLAADYSERGVIVNCVCPGATNTDMMNNGDSPEQVDEFTKRFPVGRYAEPREIANVILFASSDEASNMAGSIIMQAVGDGRDTLIHAIVRQMGFYIPFMRYNDVITLIRVAADRGFVVCRCHILAEVCLAAVILRRVRESVRRKLAPAAILRGTGQNQSDLII